MSGYVNKRLFQGFIILHILHHASETPVFGSWLIEELSEHGYKLSPGTLYPILHHLEKEKLLEQYEENVNGKIRKYYVTTAEGKAELAASKKYLAELIKEIGIEKFDTQEVSRQNV
ncbi:PadR family transcriptional regulator [Acidaminobacter hydrogenoformans]|uniref:Transcriptional regulator PadR-like family protein n=1 Tax=Acidaminobacter hydrogenoformans DSM 2784 TaxID=1120920 RepID=A0A1G5RWT9_9FIRM|nr:PadR family transcriptional regulator [Acidaminobacter hydrogenoformans]SCZ78585.1 Transcriptional regulator PadR-like family protein [Acidaminobacter hydrogenoformans DSM 2784]